MRIQVGFVIWLLVAIGRSAYNWTIVDNVVREGIYSHVFPGAVIAIANTTHILYQKPYGSLTYRP